MELWIIDALIGWGLASWVIIRLTLPDPPPIAWVVASIAGIIGGVVGGGIVRASSNPMPGLEFIGALAGAAVLVGIVRTFVRTGGTRA